MMHDIRRVFYAKILIRLYVQYELKDKRIAYHFGLFKKHKTYNMWLIKSYHSITHNIFTKVTVMDTCISKYLNDHPGIIIVTVGEYLKYIRCYSCIDNLPAIFLKVLSSWSRDHYQRLVS